MGHMGGVVVRKKVRAGKAWWKRSPGHERQVGKRKLEEPNWPFGEESVVFIPRTEGEFDGAENDMLRSEDCSSCCVKRNLGVWEILRN